MNAPAERKSRDVFALVGRSGIYAVGSVLQRGINFLLIPLLTLVLSTDDFGKVAIATSTGTVLALLLGFGLDSACTLVSFLYREEKERRTLYTTLVGFIVLVSGLLTSILDLIGQAGGLNWLPGLPFEPYLRLILWTSYCSLFLSMSLAIFTALAQPLKVIGLSLLSSFLSASLALYLVFEKHQGLRGWFLANLIAAIIMALLSLVILINMAGRRGSLSILRTALRFSVPLIPHSAGSWALSISDRFVLVSYVSLGAVGVYSLGYQVGLGISICTNAISNSLFPLVNVRLHRSSTDSEVPRLGTYALLLMTILSLAAGLAGSDLIKLLTPARFHGASEVVPWVALGALFQGVYLVWSRGTWFSMRTGWVPVLTGLAAAVNLGLNLLFVPRWGIMAAAVNTTIAYGLLAILHGCLATKVFPIAWEYGRWLKLLLASTFWLIAGNSIAQGGVWLNLTIKAVVVLVLFPLSLRVMHFFTRAEISYAQAHSAQFVPHWVGGQRGTSGKFRWRGDSE